MYVLVMVNSMTEGVGTQEDEKRHGRHWLAEK